MSEPSPLGEGRVGAAQDVRDLRRRAKPFTPPTSISSRKSEEWPFADA